MVLLVCLLISEVIIQQHQLLQRSSFGGAAINGGSPRAAWQCADDQHAYQPLPSDDNLESGKAQRFNLW